MAAARSADGIASDPIASARLHGLLRFSTGVTVALVIAEAMGWAPTFVPPLLVAVLLANLPGALPLKAGVALIVVMAAAAWVSFILPSLLDGSPQILLCLLGIIVFLAFSAMARGGGGLPALLLLICVSTVPVVALAYPAQASILPIAMVRGIAIAVVVIWCMHAFWPQTAPQPKPPAPSPIESPVRKALAGTLVVMPMMLVFLLYGLADALPVMVTTVLLVANFDPKRGATQGVAMIVGNMVGGAVGIVAFMLLQLASSLTTLAVLTFLFALGYAVRIEKGGPAAAIAVIACNTSLIILTTMIATATTSSGAWAARLVQFAIACAFAIAMMVLVWGGKPRKTAPA